MIIVALAAVYAVYRFCKWKCDDERKAWKRGRELLEKGLVDAAHTQFSLAIQLHNNKIDREIMKKRVGLERATSRGCANRVQKLQSQIYAMEAQKLPTTLPNHDVVNAENNPQGNNGGNIPMIPVALPVYQRYVPSPLPSQGAVAVPSPQPPQGPSSQQWTNAGLSDGVTYAAIPVSSANGVQAVYPELKQPLMYRQY